MQSKTTPRKAFFQEPAYVNMCSLQSNPKSPHKRFQIGLEGIEKIPPELLDAHTMP